MRRMTVAGLTGAAMTALIMLTGGFTGQPVAAHGREVIKIVGTMPGPLHAQATAKGAFNARGYFVRKKASLVFPKGRLAVRRHVRTTSYTPPNLTTCWFKIKQSGTFRVFYATGRYRGLRYSGQFSTTFSGRLKRTGPGQCGSKIVYYRIVTYEIGKIP